MKELVKGRLEGLNTQMAEFSAKLDSIRVSKENIGQLNGLILEEMRSLGFDSSETDRFDNTVGIMNGFSHQQDIALVFHIDYPSSDPREAKQAAAHGAGNYRSGIVSALYTAAVLKRSLLPLTGDLIVCGVPRSACCGFGIKYLFEYFLNKRVKNLKGIILCEPTGMNLYLGHKGRMEYEIVVKSHLNSGFLPNQDINMLGSMFPLLHELEAVSQNLPSNYALGNSSLRIKDVHFCGFQPSSGTNEFKVLVDRAYGPEEHQQNILDRAKSIATSVYGKDPGLNVRTAVSIENFKTLSGASVVSEKDIKPWTIEATHPFVLESLQALADNGLKAGTGYWKNTVTDGSYTFGELGIPTFGFGPESETQLEGISKPADMETLKKAVFAQAMMVHRSIGIPTFGWSSSDEI